MTDSHSLIDTARAQTIGVVGSSLAGLLVAWECAKVGMNVIVWEQDDRTGGAMHTATVGGARVDVGIDVLASHAGSAGADEALEATMPLLTELGLTTTAAATSERWLASQPVRRLPSSRALGVVDNAFDPDVRAIIGWAGAWRAYADRLKPVLTIGREENLGALVLARQGRAVRDKIVAAHTRALLGLEPDDVLAEHAVPQLNGELTRTGSLAGAAAVLPEPPAPLAVTGGMSALTDALVTRLRDLGVTVLTSTRVLSAARDGDAWQVETIATAPTDDAAAATEHTRVTHLVLAVDEASAYTLLAHHLPDLPAPAAMPTAITTLAVTGLPAGASRGAGFFAASADAAVRRIDHVSALWPDAQAAHDTLRVEFAHTADAHDAATALAAASAAFGADLNLVDAHTQILDRAQPRESRHFADRVQAVRRAIERVNAFDVVGSWVAGATVAESISDALTTAEAIRRHALFTE